MNGRTVERGLHISLSFMLHMLNELTQDRDVQCSICTI